MTSRARSYALMLAGAFAGGLLGALFDQVTVSISPAYFVIGKGLSVPAAELRAAAAWTGFRGGLALGALTVGTGLWLEAQGTSLRWPRWLLAACASASITAVMSGALMPLLDPFDVRQESAGTLDEQDASRYLAVWGAHIGAYLGAMAGVTAMVAQARACRSAPAKRSRLTTRSRRRATARAAPTRS